MKPVLFAVFAALFLFTACSSNDVIVIEPKNVTNLTVTDTLVVQDTLLVTGQNEIFGVKNLSTTGAELDPGQMTFYVNETVGVERLVFVVKESNGTVVTGSVNLN